MGASWGVFPVRATYFNQNGEQPVHFGARSQFSPHQGRLYFTDARHPEVRINEGEGELSEMVRFEAAPRPVASDDLALFKASAIEEIYGTREGSSAGRRQWEELLDEIPSEKQLPYFSDLFVDPEGNVLACIVRSSGGGTFSDGSCSIPPDSYWEESQGLN